MQAFKLNNDQWELLRTLRAAGCAVTVFLPHEINEANPRDVEDEMRAAGWNEINKQLK